MSVPYIDIHTHTARPAGDHSGPALPVTSEEQAAAPDHLAGADILSPRPPVHEYRPPAAKGVLAVQSIRFTGDTSDTLPGPGPYSAGIHPWDAVDTGSDTFRRLAELCEDERIVMIGETGLDYSDSYKSSAAAQIRLLEIQIDLAETLGKPLIIHNVHALDDCYRLLKNSRVPVILHGFTGPAQAAGQWLGAISTTCFSFGPSLLRSHKAQQTLAYIWDMGAQDRIFFETDEGTDSVEEIYTFAADVLKTRLHHLQEMVAAGFQYLFPAIPLE